MFTVAVLQRDVDIVQLNVLLIGVPFVSLLL
jgi:hypothetical protein